MKYYTPKGVSYTAQDVRQVMGVFIGPILLAIGLWMSSAVISDHLHFEGAPHVSAVVVSVAYVKPDLKEDGGSMELLLSTGSGPESVAVADAGSAPGGLSVNDKVVVLYNPQRSADALFPSQLGWGKVLFPLGFVGIGLVHTVIGVVSLVGRIRKTRVARQ